MKTLVAVLWASTIALAQPTEVMVHTHDGQRIKGTIDISSLRIESDFGTMDLKVQNLADVDDPGADNKQSILHLRDEFGSIGTLDAKVCLDAWEVTTVNGKMKIEPRNASVEFLFVQSRGAPPGPAPGQTRVGVAAGLNTTLNGTVCIAGFKVTTNLGVIDVKMGDFATLEKTDGDKEIVKLADGTVLTGKISVDTWELTTAAGKFTIKDSDLKALGSFDGMQRLEQHERAQQAANAAAAQPKKAEPAPGMKPQKKLALKTTLGGLIGSSDGKQLYVLDAAGGKLLVVDSETFARSAEIALHGGETVMSISKDGRSLVAGGSTTLSIVDLSTRKMTKSFAIEKRIKDVWAKDSETLYVSTETDLLQVSVQRSAVTATIPFPCGFVRVREDGKAIYGMDGMISITDPKGGAVLLPYPDRPTFCARHFSADGRFAFDETRLFRLGRSCAASAVECLDIEKRCWSAAFLQKANRLLVFTFEGEIRAYDLDTFELVKSWPFGLGVDAALVDESKSLLYVIAGPLSEHHGGSGPGRPWTFQGDLYRFDLPK